MTDDLLQELKALTRGRGLYALDLPERLGPTLSALCEVTPDDSPIVMREKASRVFQDAVDRLPSRLRTVASAALGLDSPNPDEFLAARLARAGQQLGISQRTTRRHADSALRVLGVELRARHAAGAPEPSWYTHSVRALLRLDTPAPQLVEERHIVATVDGLHEITVAVSVPDTPEGAKQVAEASIVHGGLVVRSERVSRSNARTVVRLPQVLRRGEHHEYGVQFRLPPGHDMRPHYVLTPLQPVSQFAVRVRFDMARPPELVWRVGGVPPRVVDDAEPSAHILNVDSVGEVALGFERLRPGLSYGIQWRPG